MAIGCIEMATESMNDGCLQAVDWSLSIAVVKLTKKGWRSTGLEKVEVVEQAAYKMVSKMQVNQLGEGVKAAVDTTPSSQLCTAFEDLCRFERVYDCRTDTVGEAAQEAEELGER